MHFIAMSSDSFDADPCHRLKLGAKADEVFETSGRTIEQSFASLRAQLEPVTRIGAAERIA